MKSSAKSTVKKAAIDEKKEVSYDTNLINMDLVKKFDTEAMLDSGGFNNELHLPRGKF